MDTKKLSLDVQVFQDPMVRMWAFEAEVLMEIAESTGRTRDFASGKSFSVPTGWPAMRLC